ncbi:uncharacterized protein [Antedon mediterranea]|uniref:uncharacterized protein n=1 Tax=Antedon mediterranea TaxID=105859 RepID=UPI003AF45E9A
MEIILSNQGVGKSFLAQQKEDERNYDVEKARQVALLFNRERLKDLKQGFNMVMEAFIDVLELDPAKEVSITYRNYQQKLQSIENESWSRLRQRHLNGHPDLMEDFNTNMLLSDRLLQFVSTLDNIRQTLFEQIQNSSKREDSLLTELKNVRGDLAKEKQTSTNLKWKLDKMSKEFNSKMSCTAILSEQLQDKQRVIEQLHRNGTVQLWEKEKKILLENVAQHEKELEKELADLQKVHEQTKDRLNRRNRELDEKLKVEKMKDIVSRIAERGETFVELEDCRRRMYTLERDMTYIEKEIEDHQKLFVGCIKGVREDFLTIVERDKENGTVDKDDVRKMTLIMDAIYNGVRSGRLDITKADLPLHYIALEEEITGHPSKKKITKTQYLHIQAVIPVESSKLRPVEKHLEGIDTCDKKNERVKDERLHQSRITTSSTPSCPSAHPPTVLVVPESTDEPNLTIQSAKTRIRSGRPRTSSKSPRLRPKTAKNITNPGSNERMNKTNNGQIRVNSTQKHNSRRASTYSFSTANFAEHHTELINIRTGQLNIKESMKLFKCYTKEQILEHYNMFIKYDTSKDYSLDLSETSEAIHSTVGDYYTQEQIKEVMEEVDVNHSNSIDFYEYLGIASMLKQRSGNSKVFKSGIVRHGGTSVSKMCVVQ